ncbi:hypothetical protein [Pleomorphomonas sp. PLEO]|uniref:hypothetical protein n=1 Tax=Pleomorphomonas sp. PLEO TaxID=3239306 RepID=UPI00351EED79
MRTSALMFLLGVLAGFCCDPALAHMPYFSQAESIPTTGYEAVTLRLLHGDGIFLSDPARAVVISGDGRLLATSPVSMSLRIICEGTDLLRKCQAYDDLTRTVYQPDERQWRDSGLIERDGQLQNFPAESPSDFGFVARPATLGEIVRFEVTGLMTSWTTTGAALAWWTAFWLLLLPVARFLAGRGKPSTITTLVVMLLRTAGALLMIPMTAYAWLMAPYSALYLAFVVAFGAMAAHLMMGRRRQTTA